MYFLCGHTDKHRLKLTTDRYIEMEIGETADTRKETLRQR